MTDDEPARGPRATNAGAAYISIYEPGDADGMPARDLLKVVFRRRRQIAFTTVVVPLALLTAAMAMHRTYTSSVSFFPQGRRATSNLAGIAAQFGVSVPGSEPAQTSAFYVDLLQSREILGHVLEAPYSFAADTGKVQGTLVSILRARGDTPGARRESALEDLRHSVGVSLATKTGVVTASVRERWPELAKQVADTLVSAVNEFNLKSSRSRATLERRFTSERLAETRTELHAQEDVLQSFLQRNRQAQASSQLRFEQDRLEREVTLKQQIYTAVAQAYEQARIEEVRNSPSITVIDEPALPARPDSRGLVLKSIVGILVGLVTGLLLAFMMEYFGNNSAGDTHRVHA